MLVDEYDKPILDNITKAELAIELRDELKNYYSVIKDSDRYIKLCFITGVSKFSKVNLFSGLNNLNDITLDSEYGDICGYNQQELENIFSDRLKNFDKEKVKKWYNGYSFTGKSVYNPFDILFLFEKKEFDNYWFETGTPTFLIKLISKNNYFIPNMEDFELSKNTAGNFDIDNIELETLLFQTGYLTIKEKKQKGSRIIYKLGFPNLEVKMSLTDTILKFLSNRNIVKEQNNLYDAMFDADLNKLKDIFHSFFASIPSDWYRKNTIANYEGYYSSIFYCYMTALGLDVIPEDVTNQGRIDLTAKIEDKIYIMEFKVIEMVKDGNTAFNQIKEKNYHEKYLAEGKDIYILGVEFSKETRNITGYKWEHINY
ncbi:MAG: AAA family ATPase [Spirochaetaceae bacterium]|nr:AAA family ATPase [Spirochaetaceae bacterium]